MTVSVGRRPRVVPLSFITGGLSLDDELLPFDDELPRVGRRPRVVPCRCGVGECSLVFELGDGVAPRSRCGRTRFGFIAMH
ncbi:MAG: hypothetical protein N2037_13575 [Acidimicrobiales bacterium]|nr:hypothetical protein [Acidimicrobiales bacterium]